MESYVAMTDQIDDPQAAADELAQQLEGIPLRRNSIGLLFCYSDADTAGLAELLQQRFPFDIFGCTTIASMDSANGFHEMAATLTIYTADDCQFHYSLSDPITPDNVSQQVAKTYADATSALAQEPQLILALPPYLLEIILDAYTDALNQCAPGVPAIGGLPFCTPFDDNASSFYQGKSYRDRLMIIAISGHLRPVFSIQTASPNPLGHKRKVTSADGNIIYQVGGQTMVDYLQDMGLPMESLVSGNTTINFLTNPLRLERTFFDHGQTVRLDFLRSLHAVDLENGSATAVGRVPEGATISICPMDREEISRAASRGIQELKTEMAAHPQHEYHTILAMSCVGRHTLMTPHNHIETAHLLEELPPGMTLSGFYSYGEIGPIASQCTTEMFAHNESLVLCAF